MLMAVLGAAFRVERGGGGGDRGAQVVGEQVLEDVIGADSQAPGRIWVGCVAVAEVPGDASQGQGVGRVDVEDGFRRGADENRPPSSRRRRSPSRSTRASARSRRNGWLSSVVRRRRRRWRSSKARVTVAWGCLRGLWIWRAAAEPPPGGEGGFATTAQPVGPSLIAGARDAIEVRQHTRCSRTQHAPAVTLRGRRREPGRRHRRAGRRRPRRPASASTHAKSAT